MTDKHIPASKFLALKDYWDERMGCMTVRSDDIRALIDAEPESVEPVAIVDKSIPSCEIQYTDAVGDDGLPDGTLLFAAPPANNLIAEKQATIDRLTSQRDRLLSSLKLNVPDCEAVFCNTKATYEYHDYEGTFCKCEKHKGKMYEINDDWNEAVRLIAEIEGHSKYARDE